MLWYGFGRSLVGFMSCCAPTAATPASTSAAAVITYAFTLPPSFVIALAISFFILHSSFSDVSLNPARADFRPVDDAVGVGRDALGRARRPRAVRVRFRIGDERGDAAVARAADADAAFSARVVAVLAFDVARLRVGHVQRVVPIDEEAARTAELLPLGEEAAVLIEDLDPVVAPVGDEQSSLRVHREAVRLIELDAAAAFVSDRLDERAVLRQLDDARDVAAVTFGDEDVAVRRHEHVVRLIEEVAVASAASLAEDQQQTPFGAELEDLMTALAVGHPDVAVAIHEDAVGEGEHAGAETLDELAGGIEVEDRIERGVRAAVGAAAFRDPDAVAVLVDVDGARRAPDTPLGELGPAFDRAERVGGIGGLVRVRDEQRGGQTQRRANVQ